MKVAIVGDIHGNPNVLSSKSWPEGKDFGPDDLVIFLGDFGLFWSNPMDKEENYWMKWLLSKPYQVAFLDGNHENFDLINALPEDTKWNGKVGCYHRNEGTLYHLKRGEIYDIAGEKMLVIGGGLSIDKHLRQEGISWWSQEMHSKADEENTLDNLDKVNWKVDRVLTHTCPDSVIYYVIDGPPGVSEKFRDPVARFLEFIANKLDFKKWDFGHFHCNRSFADPAGDEYECHYGAPKIIIDPEDQDQSDEPR